MQALNDFLVSSFGDLGPFILVGALGFLLILLAIPLYFQAKNDPMGKIGKNAVAKPTETEDRKALRQKSKGPADKLDRFSSFLEPQDKQQYSAIRLKLLQAGYPGKESVLFFHFAQMALAVVGLLGGFIYAVVTNAPDGQAMLMNIGLPGGAGYMLPKYWIDKRRAARQDEIQSGFPDSLDLMLVCVEAGQSLDQSIVRVSKELRASYPALADEFEIVAYEMKAGKDKAQVLKDMSERCGVQDISSFVTVLIQSQTFGTSIAEALRVYAEEMRDKRVMRAEEKANKLPTKLTLGTMMFTVPPLLIILLGPSVHTIVENLGN